MGSHHYIYGINNQDYGLEYKNIMCVVDGCSQGKHSEVGAKLFIKKLYEFLKTKDNNSKELPFITTKDIFTVFKKIMDYIVEIIDDQPNLYDIINFMCFTIVFCQKTNYGWKVWVFGDGTIITQDYNNDINFIEINKSNTPYYPVYLFMDDRILKKQEHPNKFNSFMFAVDDFQSIGIASDGLSYIIGTNYEDQFKKHLLEKKDYKIQQFINKCNYQFKECNGFFKDDITIIME